MPIEAVARMYSSATGKSVSCIAVRVPKIDTSLPAGPNGITAKAMNAGMAQTIGARM